MISLIKKYCSSIVVFFTVLQRYIYNVFAYDSMFWDYYYVVLSDISISVLLVISASRMKSVTLRGIAVLGSFLFAMSAVGEVFNDLFWIAFASVGFFISYGILFRSVFGKHLKSEKYSNKGNYIVIRKPKRIFELMRAYIMLDSVGSLKIVKDGRQFGFKYKRHNIEAIESKHTYNPEYYIYIKTDKDIHMIDRKYNILFNNCLNCWSVNVLKELKWNRTW